MTLTLESIYYIGQTVAVIVIVATLFAVFFQMRQANLLAKMETTRSVWMNTTQNLAEQVSSDEKAEFLHRALFASGPINDHERTRLGIVLASYFVAIEAGLEMHEKGMLDSVWKQRMLSSTEPHLAAPRGQKWWAIVRETTFAPNKHFVAEMDGLLEKIRLQQKAATTNASKEVSKRAETQ